MISTRILEVYISVRPCIILCIFVYFYTFLYFSVLFRNFVRKMNKIHSNVQKSTQNYRNSQKFTEIYKDVLKNTFFTSARGVCCLREKLLSERSEADGERQGRKKKCFQLYSIGRSTSACGLIGAHECSFRSLAQTNVSYSFLLE